jgi:hypothetical protein
LPRLARRAHGRVGISGIESLVPQTDGDAVAPTIAARLRSNLNPRTVASPVRGGGVPTDTDLLDLPTPWKLAAREAVDSNIEIGADELFQHLGELGGVVGQRCDLLGGEPARECLVALFGDDLDLRLDRGDLGLDGNVRAASVTHDDVRMVQRCESRALDVSNIGSGGDALEDSLSALAGGEGRRLAIRR